MYFLKPEEYHEQPLPPLDSINLSTVKEAVGEITASSIKWNPTLKQKPNNIVEISASPESESEEELIRRLDPKGWSAPLTKVTSSLLKELRGSSDSAVGLPVIKNRKLNSYVHRDIARAMVLHEPGTDQLDRICLNAFRGIFTHFADSRIIRFSDPALGDNTYSLSFFLDSVFASLKGYSVVNGVPKTAYNFNLMVYSSKDNSKVVTKIKLALKSSVQSSGSLHSIGSRLEITNCSARGLSARNKAAKKLAADLSDALGDLHLRRKWADEYRNSKFCEGWNETQISTIESTLKQFCILSSLDREPFMAGVFIGDSPVLLSEGGIEEIGFNRCKVCGRVLEMDVHNILTDGRYRREMPEEHLNDFLRGEHIAANCIVGGR